ncbi:MULTISPECIES: Maf family nucleotide pyrophosphatase [Mesotoga]|uniref:dTTP/UTP pyrophosphatase n=2 Tax=Mesotoga TaxID=1184396 RepID=I2F2Z2_9BACT|nr:MULTISPECIES: Maf family nucleotide pyrophosphatase [Mesotoga]MCP5456566.1 septum formation protein Maf [Thermotogota bacterium]AFK06295.1 MAF protein [Mesotoga prima MesG1.Ag.4.2]MCP5460522.1 septum formation protein Maf [Thermotogota bacterium]MDK2943311.1 nucleoside triphosphate pyrophosphatase [Mesotoga sp.]HNQ70123.1 Maf family nucleotide pyrophosphatase [Mesotoga prima]
MARLILGSSSPRRRELLHLLRVSFEVIPPKGVEENLSERFCEKELCELSHLKAKNVMLRNPFSTVIAADTVVVLDGLVLGKPSSVEEAYEMLLVLSGRTHSVFTSVSVMYEESEFSFVEKTDVTFREVPSEVLKEYAESGLSLDKAGAYGIQDYGALFVKSIAGDFYNVMGLPIGRLWHELHARGVI